MNKSKGFIVFRPKDDDVQANKPFYQAGHILSSGIYALHPLNRTNQVPPLVYCTEDPLLERHFRFLTLVHCLPSNEWEPGGATGETKGAMKPAGLLSF